MSDLIDRLSATSIPVMPKEHRNYRTYNLDDAYEDGWNDALASVNELPSAQPETHEKRTETHGVCLDAISRQAAIEAFDNLEWFHQNANKDMVSGANSAEHQAWYKAEDVYRVLEQLPSAQPDLSEYSDKLWKKAYERGKAEAQQRWIPCSERLPEPRVAVLGYAPKFKNIFALYYDSVMGWMVWSPIRDDCLPNSQGDIIAWMPLPEPYAERRTDE